MSKKIAIIIYLVLVGVATIISAQEMHFTNINTKLQIPSLECYNVIQDSKGYIWICTENGLVKYSKDGKKVFDKLNGLDENEVFFIAENKSNDIELMTSNNRLLTIRNDSIIEDKKSKSIENNFKKKAINGSFNVSYLLNRKPNGDLIINSAHRTYLVSSISNEIIDLTKTNEYNSDAFLIIDKNNNEDFFIKNLTGRLNEIFSNNYIINIDVFAGANKKRISLQFNENTRLDWRVRICNLENITYLTLHDRLIKIDENLNVEYFTYPSVITSIHLSNKKELWIGTSSFGVFHYSDINNMSIVSRALNGLTVSSVLVDREGGAWCTTTEKGVYYSANYSILHYPKLNELNKKTTLLKAIDQKIFISTEIDKLNVLENDQVFRSQLLETGNSDIVDVIQFKDEIFLASKGYIGLLDDHYRIKKIMKAIHLNSKVDITAYQLDKTIDNLYALGVGSLFKLNGDHFELINITLKSKGRCFKVLNDTVIYVGCNDGLYKLNLVNNAQQKIEFINTAVSKIIIGNDNIIYFTTKGQGLFKLIKDTAVQINLGNNSHILNDVVEDRRKHLWISSNDGLIKLRYQNGNYTFEKYNTSNGLISNNMEHLTIVDDYLYVSSENGIFKFHTESKLLNTTPPKIYINEVKVNDSIINYINNHFNLRYFENSITVILDHLSFKNGKNESILYKLNGYDNKFKAVKSNKLIFENLPPNKYELIIYTINNDGVKSEKPIILSFAIWPPFWKTWWFIIAGLLLLLLIIYLTIVKIINNVKRQEEEKTAINKLISEYQLRGLQAQMNPHFIFNAINSIQNYVLNKKEDEAYDYLAKFSKLIRMVLNNSRDKEITLKTELETLNLYIELEQLRFDNSFVYLLNVSNQIELFEIEIPAMMIQPYVENAIWHGLMNLKDERNAILKIDISIEQTLLKVVVEDNGIGRARANEFKKSAFHYSLAMQLTNERLEMLKRLENSKNIKVNIIDLYDESQNAIGTRVELFLPLMND